MNAPFASEARPEEDGRSPASQGRAGGPSDLSRSASQPEALIPNAAALAPSLTPDLAGELLREVCFAESYGAYSCFDMAAGFVALDPFRLGRLARTALLGCEANTPPLVERIEAFVHPCGLIAAWHWDGDGTLVFKRAEFMIWNGDCKKDHGWERLMPGDWVDDYRHYDEPASAIEARRAATAKAGAVEDESAVPKGDAQTPPKVQP